MSVPIVSVFFGIVVRMDSEDHSPAHFHAEFGGDRASFSLLGERLSGEIRSCVARRLIREWAQAHRDELELNWSNSREARPMHSIEPPG